MDRPLRARFRGTCPSRARQWYLPNLPFLPLILGFLATSSQSQHLKIQASKPPPPFGAKLDLPRTLYFDKYRQERIFNAVIDGLGLRDIFNACTTELHSNNAIFEDYQRWSKTIAESNVFWQESITKGDIPMPEDRLHKIKLCNKLQRQMDKAL